MHVAATVVFFCVSFLTFPSMAQVHDKGDSLSKIERTKTLNTHQDTVQALEHLFQRKRRSARIKGAIIGVLIDALVIRTWTRSYYHPQGNLPPGVVTVGSSASAIPTTNYIFLGASTILVVEILAQHSYGPKRLRALLDDYKIGRPIPKKVKSKISWRDFD